MSLQKSNPKTILISKDLNVRIKADALGLLTQDFEAQKVDAERLYRGYVTVVVPDELIDTLYKEKHVELASVA